MVELIPHRLFDNFLGVGGGELVLGLALEFRLADEHRQHGAGAVHHVFGGDRCGALALAGAFGVILQPRVSAVSRIRPWVPPSGVGMVLQYELRKPSASAVQATAHCAPPCAPASSMVR